MSHPNGTRISPIASLPLSDPRCMNTTCIAYAAAMNASRKAFPFATELGYADWNAWYYACIIFLFSLFYLYQLWDDKHSRSSGNTAAPIRSTRRKAAALVRYFSYRRVTTKPLVYLGFPSWGVIIIFLASTAWLASVAFGPYPYFRERRGFGGPPIGLRTGAMAISCLPLIIALSGKANLVTLLTGISYEKLNVFHRFVGLMCFCLALVHATAFLYSDTMDYGFAGLTARFHTPNANEFSGVPTFAMFFGGVVIAVPWIRRRVHELFYHLHVIFVTVFIGLLFWHTYDVGSVWNYLYATVALWATSILARTFHFNRSINPRYKLFKGWSSHVQPLAGGLTRIDVQVPLNFTWQPGQHAFIRCPSLSVFENHPFSIATSPTTIKQDEKKTNVEEPARYMTFFARSYSGFTKKLSDHAHTRSEISTDFWIDGPYGGINRRIERSYDAVLLIAGGSGVTACLPWLQHVANQMVLGHSRTKHITLIWIIRDATHFAWVDDELSAIAGTITGFVDVKVEMMFYVTSDKLSPASASPQSQRSLEEKNLGIEKVASSSEQTSISTLGSRLSGRPDVDALVMGAVTAPKTMVIGCGPESLKLMLSNACAKAQKKVLRGEVEEVALHTETFGW